jgi:hypothetical protein
LLRWGSLEERALGGVDIFVAVMEIASLVEARKDGFSGLGISLYFGE